MRYIQAVGLLFLMLTSVTGYGQGRSATPIRKPNLKSNRKVVLEGVAIKVPLPLVQAMARDDESIRKCVENFDVNSVAEYLSAQEIDLGRDETPELLLYSSGSPGDFGQCLLCGLRRCDYWLYRTTATGYELLLKLHGPEAIFSRETSSNGYRDLEVIYPPGTDLSVYAQTYRFDGRQYQEVRPSALHQKALPPRVSHVQKTRSVTSPNLAAQRNQSNLAAKKAWPPFFAKLRAAVKKRDQATLKVMMPPEFTYDCCVNEDENGNGETRDEAFRAWDSSNTEGWDALNSLLAQGVVPASAQWTRQNGRSKPNFIAPPSANRNSYDGPIADFEYRNGRWYFVSFQFNEGDDVSGQNTLPTIRISG